MTRAPFGNEPQAAPHKLPLEPENTARVALLAAISKARMIATAATYLQNRCIGATR